MEKYFVYVLGIVLMFAPRSRADITVSDGSAHTFQTAVGNTIGAGGGNIIVTTPVVISSTNDPDDQIFDGESIVTVSGGGASSIFLVQDASLELDNLTLQNGFATNGGAIYVSPDGDLTISNCTFANNLAQGDDGFSTATGTNDTSDLSDPSELKKPAKTNAIPIRATAGLPAAGGAIFNLGSATVLRSRFFTNSAIGGAGGDAGTGGGNEGTGGAGGGARGGGVYSLGTLLLAETTFSGNLATGGKGGLGYSGTQGNGGTGGSAAGAGLYTANTNTIFDCTFSQNVALGGGSADGGTSPAGIGRAGRNGAPAWGGGVNNAGSLFVTNSTFFANNAIGGTGGTGGQGGGRGGGGGNGGSAIGGGIYNTGTVWVVNCTFSKDGAFGGTNGPGGGGIVAGRSGNRGANSGGNIANVAKKKKGSFHLMNSIIATSLSGGSGFGTIVDESFNISADKSIKFKKSKLADRSLPNTNPLIGDLANNGGPTQTIALTTNSPALDKIDPALAPEFDQRGVHRPQPTNSLSDIGAYELDVNSAQIFTQPVGITVNVGTNVTFSVQAFGTPPLFYRWIFTNSLPNIANGVTNSTLVLTNVQVTNSGAFRVIVSNAFNSVTSDIVQLTVNAISNSPPAITVQPVSQTVVTNTSATFTVTATGSAPLRYQWVFQGSDFSITNIAGATNPIVTIANVTSNNVGNYAVSITNNFGAIGSAFATLHVTTNSSGGGGPPPPGGPSIPSSRETRLVPLAAVQDGTSTPSVHFTFQSQAAATYVIEYKSSLTDPVWIPISTNIGTGDWLTNQIPITTQPTGFYRVRSQ